MYRSNRIILTLFSDFGFYDRVCTHIIVFNTEAMADEENRDRRRDEQSSFAEATADKGVMSLESVVLSQSAYAEALALRAVCSLYLLNSFLFLVFKWDRYFLRGQFFGKKQ
ncbi:hypothetical protein SAMN02745131_01340 [Flavisolibacter ginsengisoli DSM 18119]|jgi:hypothetical protein|uniref:Uncharacterized protein n=1 Tax=Flavisolibacter ginsengisoli DSM 18119 TaxID=1121884 RepID=A0A1M4X584_9BACT|nr:hypothetical protein SAMN02745131_01340 [Flavisolibacter ginsengisoli DSM 18119]